VDGEQKKLWKRLMSAWNAGQVACRIHLARLYTEKYPNDTAGWVALADILGSLAQYREARSALDIAMKLASKDERKFVFHQIGHLYREKGDYRRSEFWYRRAVEAETTTDNLVFLGACLARQGQHAEAKQYYQQAIELVTSEPDEAYFNLGLVLRAEGNYKEALRCFEKAIDIDPEYVLAIKAKNDILAFFEMIENG
jgi:tetratricopeptide (TPR) repeat protein